MNLSKTSSAMEAENCDIYNVFFFLFLNQVWLWLFHFIYNKKQMTFLP